LFKRSTNPAAAITFSSQCQRSRSYVSHQIPVTFRVRYSRYFYQVFSDQQFL